MQEVTHTAVQTKSSLTMPPSIRGKQTMKTFEKAFEWLAEPLASNKRPRLLLGNGFSMALDPSRFSYSALAYSADSANLLPSDAQKIMAETGIVDFETIIRKLEDTARTLNILDEVTSGELTARLTQSAESLREALAHSIAGLHPDRPFDIEDSRYLSTRKFLDRFSNTYTVNYDLLLYWSVMQDLPGHPGKAQDDGFRDSRVEGDETVIWDIYSPHTQTIHYLHGALHLFLGIDGLRKITWNRTDLALIDQVRAQLQQGRFPLYVAEGESEGKLDKINRSAYLSKGLRSLAACGGSLMIYGHSLGSNDAHIFRAITRSKIRRIAVSIYGDPDSDRNREIARRARHLVADRIEHTDRDPLEVDLFDATNVSLWTSSSG